MLRRLTGPASRLPGYMATVTQNSAMAYARMQRLSAGMADLDRSADRTPSKRPHANLWVACTPSCAGFQGQSGAVLAAVDASKHFPELQPEHKLRTCPSPTWVHHVWGSMKSCSVCWMLKQCPGLCRVVGPYASVRHVVQSAAEQGLSQALLFWCFGDSFLQSCASCSAAHATCADRHL